MNEVTTEIVYTPFLRDPNVLSECTFLNDEEKETLVSNIAHRLTPHPVKIRAGDSPISSYLAG